MENPGFFFDFQLIDVQDFNGVGESEPNPYFYQVSTLNFTRLHGEDLISPSFGDNGVVLLFVSGGQRFSPSFFFNVQFMNHFTCNCGSHASVNENVTVTLSPTTAGTNCFDNSFHFLDHFRI